MRRSLSLLLILVLMSVLLSTVYAESKVIQGDLGSRSYRIRYDDAMPASKIEAVKDSLIYSTLILDGVFQGRPEFNNPVVLVIFVDVLATGPKSVDEKLDPSTLGRTGGYTQAIPNADGSFLTSTRSCRIQLFNQPLTTGNTGQMRLTTAHETVHCYQVIYVPAAHAGGVGGTRWWFEGSAQWLMSKIYPIEGQILSDMQISFVLSHRNKLTELAYEAGYFWMFMESEFGQAKTMDFLVGMPPDPTTHAAYLRDTIPNVDEFFHKYAIALEINSIPYQPAPNQLIRLPQVQSSNPMAVNAAQFSIALDQINWAGLAAGNEVVITAQGIESNGLRATLISGSEMIPLHDGTSITVCPSAETMTLVQSRAYQTGEAGYLAMELTGNTCAPQQAPPPCIVGSWDIAVLPEQIEANSIIEYEDDQYMLIFNPDGTWLGIIENVTTSSRAQPDTTVVMNLDYAGTINFTPTGEPRTYAATGTGTLQPGASAVANVSGMEIDVTDAITGLAGAGMGIEPAMRVVCSEDGNTLEYTVSGNYTYILRRDND